MADISERPTPPEGLPPKLVDALTDCTPEELRKAIVHAQELLHFHGEAALPVDPEAGDDILRVTEHEEYTAVVKQFRCADGCDDCPHGPYLYHVTEEPQPDGNHKVHWTFMGTVRDEK
ncbi:hypothetical protein C461_04907 [Halorubrum aidingense JCM 13560]|uniref:Uncharacterized protein n=1 Tax=Halorubrum aidingense JCM 13560 TaxID=1230454 RepID=M0PFR5_9EURY|nr:hypothetical protein [Halorubrum aidingense]EMA68942.1 hypothetical protein C461_04907 [Halorubrum aidingense JCM 13560]